MAKANLQRKRCASGHEYDDFDTTTASILSFSLTQKVIV